MGRPGRIPIPLRHRWHSFRSRLLPLAVWLAAVAAIAVLWGQRMTRVDGTGMFDGRRAEVMPGVNSRIARLYVVLGQEVAASQVLARLDDTEVQAALSVAKLEVQRIEAGLRAARLELQMEAAFREQEAQERKLDLESRQRNYEIRVERLRLDKLDRTIQLANDEVQLKRLAASLARNTTLHEKGVVGDEELDAVRYEHEAMQRKIEANRKALEVVEGQLKNALERKSLTGRMLPLATGELALEPLKEALRVQRERVREIEVQLKQYEVVAPFDGVVSAIHSYEGQAVRAGDVIVTVVDPEPIRILGYLQPGKRIRPYPGMEVEVRRRTQPMQVVRSRVVQVGSEVELIPPQVTGNTASALWGTRVIIELPRSLFSEDLASGNGHPAPKLGEPVDIRYLAAADDIRTTY